LPEGDTYAPAVAAAPGSPAVERQLESKLAQREALQQKMDAQALNALKLAPVITKAAEVLAKHLREKVKLEPDLSAQILRSWIRDEEN
jgi:flagellar biosynthesis/type III secretory pathway M-ring protein FliF/YscJ